MKEIWKDIEGYEGYQVSNLGRVRSLDRYVRGCWNTAQFKKGIILKNKEDNDGYGIIGLSMGGRTITKKISRLVWKAFNGPIPEGMQVNHINEVKTDNRLENLNLMTAMENNNWGTRTKRASKSQKTPVTQVLLDGTEFFTYFSALDAEEDLGINRTGISQCCKGKRKSAGGYKWKYAIPQKL